LSRKGFFLLALFLSVSPAGKAADAKKGEEIYGRCLACHALAYDRVGPRHCGLIGRKAGSVPGFEYSQAMKRSGLTWNEKTLNRFLKNPPATVPGTTMTYAGIPDAKERADLIAYLKSVNRSGACPPPASR
jgi:cytochrome c